MKSIYLILATVVGFLCYAQKAELNNPMLKEYYKNIVSAENTITKGKLDSASYYYEKAFSLNKEPNAKDLYNSLQVAIKRKDKKTVKKHIQQLDCLNFDFEDGFQTANTQVLSRKKCNRKFNTDLIKVLDSLFIIDQKYRRLSGGNYEKYRKEMTAGDSLTSTRLVQLIEKYGFPNEYDIGIGKSSKDFFHHFYYIIWHQLAGNLYSPQQVNFTKILNDALNAGKIIPEHAAFLIDLNNGGMPSYTFNAFLVHEFELIDSSQGFKRNGSNIDCCYVSENFYFPEKRNENIIKIKERTNENRKKIGLEPIENIAKKTFFRLNNREFVFNETTIIGHGMTSEDDIKNYKERMKFIKIQ